MVAKYGGGRLRDSSRCFGSNMGSKTWYSKVINKKRAKEIAKQNFVHKNAKN
jgi:hypothetical protein